MKKMFVTGPVDYGKKTFKKAFDDCIIYQNCYETVLDYTPDSTIIILFDSVEGSYYPFMNTIHKLSPLKIKQPILFINKIDRLIRELRLNEIEIYKHLVELINKINNWIQEEDYKFDVSNNIIFGSGLHKWSFTYNQLIQSQKNQENMETERKLKLFNSKIDRLINSGLIGNGVSVALNQSYYDPKLRLISFYIGKISRIYHQKIDFNNIDMCEQKRHNIQNMSKILPIVDSIRDLDLD